MPNEPRFDLSAVNPKTRAAWNSQPSEKQVIARMDVDLVSLEEEFQKNAKVEELMMEVGKLDARRKKWVLQWVHNQAMVQGRRWSLLDSWNVTEIRLAHRSRERRGETDQDSGQSFKAIVAGSSQ